MRQVLTAEIGDYSALRRAITIACLVVAGCSGSSEQTPSGRVSGMVTMKGSPVASARVNFLGKGAGASANLKADGTFQMEGPLPAGDYAVSITAAGLGDQPPSEDVKKDRTTELQTIPQKYQSETTSGLTAKVVPGSNSFPFDLTE